MTRTSTHAPRSTPFMQFLTLSMVSTSCIRLTFYGLVITAKLNLSLHATQTYDEVQVQLHVFLNSVLNEGGRSFSYDGQCVRTNNVGTHWTERSLGPTTRPDAKNQTFLLLMGIEPRILSHALTTFAISASFRLYNRNSSAVGADCG